MSRSASERNRSEEESERILRQLQQLSGQSADLIDAVRKWLLKNEEGQQLLDAILECIPAGITIAAAGDDTIRMVSKYSRQFIGYPREALEGLPLQEYVQKWDTLYLDGLTAPAAEELPLVRATRLGQVVTDEEWLLRCRDGRTIRALCNAGPIRDRRGDIIGGIVAWLDITERQRAEEALAHLAAIVESSEDAIYSYALDGAILTWNPAAERLYGYSAEEIKGQSILRFAPADRSGELRDILKRIQQGQRIVSYETVRLRKDGSRVDVSVSIAPIRDAAGRITAAAKIDRDISPRKEAEKRALQAERLAAIGQMATGLAHESGNALQRSQACLRMLALRVKDQPEALDLVNRIQKAQDHLQYLFENVRGYAAPVNLELRTCDLSGIWREAWSQLNNSREGRDVAFHEETGDLDLHCHVDGFRLVQVFRNLFDNALTACRDPVVLSVRCAHALLAGHPALRIAVRDNGPGIAAEERSKIFEPFYTTKTKGTGLGLAIVRRIIEAHRGEIAVSEDGASGAEILITLPRGEP